MNYWSDDFIKQFIDYNLDDVFLKIQSNDILFGKKVVKQIFDIRERVEDWKNWLAKDRESSERMMKSLALKPQTYEVIIDIDDSNYYQLVWDILKVKKIIRDYNIPTTKIEIKELLPFVYQEYLDTKHLVKASQNDEPIIMCYNHIINDQYILDGNHRVIGKSRYTDQQYIDVFLLNPQQHIEAMFLPIHKLLYYIHHNLQIMANYKLGTITEEQLRNYLA